MKSLFAALLLACLTMPQWAWAQEAEQNDTLTISRMALVDLNQVLREANATEDVRQLLDQKRAEFEAEFSEKEITLLQQEKDLQLKRSVMSEQAYADAVQAFQQQVSLVQRDIQTKRQALDKAFQDSQDELRSIALQVVTDIAGSERVDVVLNRNSAIIFRQELDITEFVLEQLNERTKNARLISNTE